MDIRKLTDTFFVSPQIAAEDVPAIAALGVRRIICNRPDAEVPPSHQAEAIRAAAEAAGLGFDALPLTHQTMTPHNVARQVELADAAEGPVLAYCASGTRSTVAWALGSAGAVPPDALIGAARDAGYDLANLRPTLEAAAAASKG
ncbi:MAG: TIGR01244 family sulfur transferase [Pseudomonadota bacterium]